MLLISWTHGVQKVPVDNMREFLNQHSAIIIVILFGGLAIIWSFLSKDHRWISIAAGIIATLTVIGYFTLKPNETELESGTLAAQLEEGRPTLVQVYSDL